MSSKVGIYFSCTQARISLISEQKSVCNIFPEKGATKKVNISTTINLSHFLFLFTLTGSVLASSGIFATKNKRRTTKCTSCNCAGNFSNVPIRLEFASKACN